MESPKSKPLLIIESNSRIRELVDSMDSKLTPLEAEKKKLVMEAKAIHKKEQEIKKCCWDEIEEALLQEGFIDGKDVSLSIRDGVLYQDPAHSHDLGSLLKSLFS